MKSAMPLDELAQKMTFVSAVPPALVRFIGVSELAGAIGLVLPALTRVRPGLTPLAAAGLATIMLLAALFHVPRGEFAALPMNFALGAVALFIAWGRWRKAPVAPR